MRRFFHRKAQQTRPVAATANGGQQAISRLRGPNASVSPTHGPSPVTGRIRAPALRSRSMSVLYGPEAEHSRPKRFTRSLSFCDDQHSMPTTNRKLLTQTEEDEVFRLYTRKLYIMFAALCAIIIGFVVYAYIYNTASYGS